MEYCVNNWQYVVLTDDEIASHNGEQTVDTITFEMDFAPNEEYERGLTGVQLFIGDKCLGLLEAINEVYPDAKYQRCTVHFYRNVFTVTPRSKVREVAAMMKAIRARE